MRTGLIGWKLGRVRHGAWVITACIALWAMACSRHVQLKFPESERGDAFVCSATKSSEARCNRVDTIDPALQNRSGTSFVILPRECKGSFNQITVQNSHASEPTAHVICAPLENIPE